jgi:hypothetical protein
MFKRTWIDETVTVRTSADQLYALLKDIDAWPSWCRGLEAIKRRDTAPVQVGTRFIMVLKPGIRLPSQVYTYQPDHLVWGGGAPGLVVRHSFEITAIDNASSRLRHLEYATGPIALFAIPLERLIYAYDHRWTKTIVARFEHS